MSRFRYRHTRLCEKLKLSVTRTRSGVHRGQPATPVRHDYEVRVSNVVMWTTATPVTRDATGSACLHALTLSSKLEDYCFSELSYLSCAVCISRNLTSSCRSLLVDFRLCLCTQFTAKELHSVLYLLYKTPTCFGHVSRHLQRVTSLVDLYSVYGNLS